MKLIQIQYFLMVSDCKSITKAAEALYVSQPAVTKQMNLLEEELGVKLMHRLPSGIALTEVGEEFAKDCRRILKDLDKAVSKAVNAGRKEPDILRIGCFDGAVIEDFMPELYRNLKADHPDLQIKIGRHPVSENQKDLEADGIDLLIGLKLPGEDPPFPAAEYNLEVLAKRKGALIYSKNSPLAKKRKLTYKDFEKETFFMVDQEETLSAPGLLTLRTLGLENPRVERVDNFVSLISNIRLGLGYSTLSELAVKSNPDFKAFPLPENLGLEVIAVWKKKNQFVTRLMERSRNQ